MKKNETWVASRPRRLMGQVDQEILTKRSASNLFMNKIKHDARTDQLYKPHHSLNYSNFIIHVKRIQRFINPRNNAAQISHYQNRLKQI
jgi:hypothetical protein